jgi:5-methylcytosine-specific restriction endonuclease McrA
MAVFVLDRHKKPLMPCTEKRARLLLERDRARVVRMVPFTIRLVDRTAEGSETQPLVLKIDPGSKATGMALVRVGPEGRHAVVALAELRHRGAQIRNALHGRAAHRRFRRAKLRYRPARFDNRMRQKGWLPPSLRHRVDTTTSWTNRLHRLAPITGIAVERTRFDTHLMHEPEVSGVGYQQGELQGYEVREYLLDKWDRRCMYCDTQQVRLQVEHLLARSRGGSDRVSNLGLACQPCNQAKGTKLLAEFVTNPKRLAGIEARMKAPLRDAAMMNATRYALHDALVATGLPVEASTGGRTKWNRTRFGIPKSHALDAACVGETEFVSGWQRPTLVIKATGRGSYQRTRLTAHGFPRGRLTRTKRIHDFATGDLVRADVPTGTKAGVHVGRVAVRATGRFNVTTLDGVVQGIGHRHCRLVQRADGFGYHLDLTIPQPEPKEGRAPPRPEGRGFHAEAIR